MVFGWMGEGEEEARRRQENKKSKAGKASKTKIENKVESEEEKHVGRWVSEISAFVLFNFEQGRKIFLKWSRREATYGQE